MKKAVLLLVVFQCVLVTVAISTADAAIYRYFDKNGIAWYVDNLTVIPEQYRAAAVIIDGDSKDDAAKRSGSVTIERPSELPLLVEKTAKPPEEPPRPLSVRILKSVSVVLGAILVFIVVSRLVSVRDDKKVLSIVRGSLIVILSLYLVFAHAEDMVTVFHMTKQAIEEAQHRSEEKGRKAAQAIKTLDAVFEQSQQAQQAQGSATREAEEKNH
ncbi:MAG TPA: hypothetical protein VL197_10100 [Nitrospirota bacterium]|nr:hypothetical protein [Nitrospirota bacterium]